RGGLPFLLPEGLPAAQRPVLAHALEGRARFAIARRRTAEADLDLLHAGALARLDGEAHHPGLLGRFDLGTHLRREIAVGGRRLARFVHRLVDQPLEPFGIHVRVEAPAHDVQPFLERRLQLARRLDLDAIVEACERPLVVRRAANGYFSVNGTPTDCVHIAVTGLLDFTPDVIVSGVNLGANMGDDTIYSGTVAAAVEGYLLGIPSLAVSLTSKEGA